MDQTSDDHTMLIDSMENENEKQDVTIITPGQPDSESVDENERLTADNFELMKKHLLPDEADYEIEEEAVHTWEIKGWRKLERKAHGPIFQCGGTPWRVLFFPQGNNVDHASFYLEHGFEDKPPENWYRCVCFGLVLWNPKDPSIHISHQANHRFTIEEGDWGFTRFYELRNLFAKTKDFDRPLVEDDYANLTAYVRVVKDPTGVLWHNFSNYDSKKETGYVGLKNQGATCYLNSLLQSLYFTNSFRKAVYQIPTESENLTNSALTLQRLFFRLQFSDEAVSTDELTKSFGWETQDIFAQQDVQELNRVLMENLEQKMKGTGVENFLTKLFVGKTKTYIKCINVDYTSERIEDFWDIQLNVRNFKNLHESFLDYIAVETMDGENKYFAEGHGLQDARKGVIFESFPEVLHLHLKRFEYDLNTYAMQKVNDHYEFPESFDAAPYLSEDADKSESYEYVLHGVLVHSGDLNAGHYYAFLRPQKDGDFFKFDDDRVTRATMKETMDENFGGDYAPGVNGARMRNQYTRAISVKRSMNAYMLVYLRKTKIDEILVPVDKEDTPPHLEQKINEEKLLKEQKKREKDEQHLYLNVRVIGEKQFKAHQGFDLASWDDRDQAQEAQPKTYRVLKASPVRDLVEKVAADLEADPQDVRLWVMVNRQNKTIRPDQPLTNLDMSIEEAATKLGSKSDALRIWAEQAKVADPRSNYEPWAQPRDNIPWIIVFLKYYDAENDALRGLTHVYMRKTDKVNDLFPYILNEMEWPSSVPIKLYEEIKPTMIEPMRPKQTFVQAEIQDGDIICFQKAHTEKEQLALLQSSQMPDAKDFYDHLVNKIVVKFLPRHKTEPEGKTFELMLNKKMTYDQLADKVGTYLDAPPTHLRFTGVNPSNGMPRTALKRTTNANLNNMLTNQYYSQAPTNSNTLYYEVLEMSLTELETKKTLKITYLPDGISKAEPVEVLVSKSGSIQETVPLLQKKLELDDDVAARIRFFEAHYGKLHKELDSTFNVAGITDYVTVYAEKIPDEELDMTDGDRFIAAWHFQKEPSQTHKQGIPFKFVVKNGELFEKTKERLQARTGIKGKMFEKIKFAVVKKAAYSKPIYLADDDILSDIATDADDTLGLDHMDRNSHSNGWGRTGGPEIRIK